MGELGYQEGKNFSFELRAQMSTKPDAGRGLLPRRFFTMSAAGARDLLQTPMHGPAQQVGRPAPAATRLDQCPPRSESDRSAALPQSVPRAGVSRCSNVKPKLLDYLVGNGLILPGFADTAAFDATLVNLGFGPQLRPSCNRCAPRAARLVLWLRYLFGAVRRPSPRSLRGARPLHTRRPSSR